MRQRPAHPLDEHEPPTRAFARTWAQRLHEVSFVPRRLGRTIPLLEDLTARLAAALTGDEPDPAAGRWAGTALVEAQLWSPAALRVSVELIHERLRGDLGITHPGSAERLGSLLGAFTEAFAEGVRAVALTETDDLRRHERASAQRAVLRAEQQRQHALLHDQVSGLPNRHALTDHLTALAARSDRVAVCVLNLVRFAEISDALGTDQADALLREVGLRMRDLTDTHGHYAAHLGGDEFVLVQAGTRGPDDAVKLFDLVRESLAYPWGPAASPVQLDAKGGLLERPAAGATASELLRTAKMALTWAKSDPVGSSAMFEQHRHDADRRRHTLSRDLPGAVRRGTLRLAYQPIVRLTDRRVVAVEALARWRHPQHGEIAPAEFIPLAERIGLLNHLIGAQLRTAGRHALQWQRPGRPVRLNLNLSTAQLTDQSLPAIVGEALDETGFPPDLLTFEVTEESITAPQASTLAALAALGASFAVDDFGTGYSNFARLHEVSRTAVASLKIDRSLLASSDVLLTTLVTLAHGLRLHAVAEGVETEEQAAHVRKLGYDHAQGILFGPPTVAEEVPALL
ncbi:bifunctional diguanylate cyclase/phosphodiesterase [Dactylosporangium sp. NPDC005572]|uniref:putative bifunctional diguanylate cyclase/phosphodiesterase n=1 Tax=Dactylosporangium sp. NPDC005572 TaxID=3156889 RepID=UPI0033B3C4CF